MKRKGLGMRLGKQSGASSSQVPVYILWHAVVFAWLLYTDYGINCSGSII